MIGLDWIGFQVLKSSYSLNGCSKLTVVLKKFRGKKEGVRDKYKCLQYSHPQVKISQSCSSIKDQCNWTMLGEEERRDDKR